MGRPSNGVPYLKGGVYHIRFQGDKGGGTSLNTTNARDAKRLGEALAVKRGATMPSLVKRSEPPAASRPTSTSPGTAAGPAACFPVASGSPDPLSSWLATDSEFSGGQAYTPTPEASATPDAGGAASAALSHDEEKAIKGLSADERSRMHGLLSGIVGRANVLALGLGVRVFGRIPAEPEPADLELLNRAWQLQLEELLGDKEIKPWMMIAAASAGLGVGMWAGGEPLPPKPKKIEPGAPLQSVP